MSNSCAQDTKCIVTLSQNELVVKGCDQHNIYQMGIGFGVCTEKLAGLILVQSKPEVGNIRMQL